MVNPPARTPAEILAASVARAKAARQALQDVGKSLDSGGTVPVGDSEAAPSTDKSAG